MRSHLWFAESVRRSRRFRAFAGLCASIALSNAISPHGVAAAENWPQWRGPKNDGVSAEKNLPTEWGREKNIAWRLAMPGSAGSTPAVWDDRFC
jgi:hypothetical protein